MMGYWEQVLKVMQSDPEYKWTAPEIAMILKPEMKPWEYEAVRGHVLRSLKKAAKYGLVVEIGMRYVESMSKKAKVWVLA